MTKQEKRMLAENSEIYSLFYERLCNIGRSRYFWKGMPETCDPFYFEDKLFEQGSAALIKQENTDIWLSVGYVNRGERLTVYGKPSNIKGIGATSYFADIRGPEWAICYDNRNMTAPIIQVRRYAQILTKIFLTYNNNLLRQNKPYIIATEKSMLQSFQNIMARIFGFDDVIYVKAGTDLEESFKAVPLNVEFIGTDLLRNLEMWWDIALSDMGLAAKSDKAERQNVEEIKAGNSAASAVSNSGLLMRQFFADEINNKYGLNIQPVVNEGLDLSLPVHAQEKDALPDSTEETAEQEDNEE